MKDLVLAVAQRQVADERGQGVLDLRCRHSLHLAAGQANLPVSPFVVLGALCLCMPGVVVDLDEEADLRHPHVGVHHRAVAQLNWRMPHEVAQPSGVQSFKKLDFTM